MAKPLVAIIGRPNVGKSTFFNKMAGRRISIVDDLPGVTRDRVYADVEWLGRGFTLIDTGGIDPRSEDVLFSQMREQAEIAMETADAICFFTDARDGLTDDDRVIYLGSFSSTLFPSARISYMVVPQHLSEPLSEIVREHSQSCSKAEQLALALFMERGYYRKGINRLRRMYAAKLNAVIRVLEGHPGLDVINTWSGISLLLRIQPEECSSPLFDTARSGEIGDLAAALCASARDAGVELIPVTDIESAPDGILLNLYYTRVPLADIEKTMQALLRAWQIA